MEQYVLDWYANNRGTANTILLLIVITLQFIRSIFPDFLKYKKERDTLEAINSKEMIAHLLDIIKSNVAINTELQGSVKALGTTMTIQGELLREMMADLTMVYAYLQLEYPPRLSQGLKVNKGETTDERRDQHKPSAEDR